MDRIVFVLAFVLVSVLCKNVEQSDSSTQETRKMLSPYVPPRVVECYTCTDCQIITNSTPVRICPFHKDPNKMDKCVTYVEKYKYLEKPWYIRGCLTERGSCEEIKAAHSETDLVSVDYCNECTGDICNKNGVSRSLLDGFVAFFVLVVTPILAKCILM